VTNGQRGTVQTSAKAGSERDPLDRYKSEFRARALAHRSMVARRAGSGAAVALRERLLAALEWPPGCAVSAYWPMGDEIDIRPLAEALHRRGHTIGLPVTVRRGLPLVFRAWAPGDALVPGGFGTQIPAPEQPEITPRVLLVPLLAFDRTGHRLGYGGGFYDRTLETLRAAGPTLAVGVAYAGQEVDAVPRGSHDQCLDWIMTEAEAIAVAAKPDMRSRPA